METWTNTFMGYARKAAERSKSPQPYGAVVVGPRNEVIATGYNGTPATFDDSAIKWRDGSHATYMIHAELNALWFAAIARGWVGLYGCSLYSTCRPCPTCALLICQARIATFTFEPRGDGSATAERILTMGGVKFDVLEISP